MSARLSAFLIWALVSATALFWAFRQWGGGPQVPAYAVPLSDAAPLRGDLARLVGGAEVKRAEAAPPPPVAGRFKLVGVVAPRAGSSGGTGIALLSIDNKPARPFRVGRKVDGELMLRSVAMRSATLGTASGGSPFTLELPPRQAAATGTLERMSLTDPDGGSSRASPAVAPPPAPPGGGALPPQGFRPPGLSPQQQQDAMERQQRQIQQEQELLIQQHQQQMRMQQEMDMQQQPPAGEEPPPLPAQ